MPSTSQTNSHRDSWPPTQMRVAPHPNHKDEPRSLLDDIDENPLTYFLTPSQDSHCGEYDDDEGNDDYNDVMDFDAGIDDPNHPREMIRSVSPSTLSGFSKPEGQPPSSPELPDSGATSPDDNDDDDEEGEEEGDYISFHPSRHTLRDRDLAVDSLRYRPRSPSLNQTTNALLSPYSFPSQRGRTPVARLGLRVSREPSRSASASGRHRTGRLWREPSPDVWSIEEETEEEMMMVGAESGGVEKTRKRVRFVLPTKG